MFGGNGGRKDAPIPAPNVTVRTGDDAGEWTPEQIRGILCNPIYAGISPFPSLVSDEAWVKSAALLKKEYRAAIAENRMIVFVRDNEARTLKSASYPIEPFDYVENDINEFSEGDT